MLRIAIRATLLACLVAAFLARGRRAHDDAGLRAATRRASRYARRAARVLGIRLTQEGRLPVRSDGRLLVANHLSWIDPLLLAAHRPAVFVTSVETAEDGFLGRICAIAGCVFMERRRRGGLRDECAHLARLLGSGDVMVFPEATTGDGSRLLPFRSACFASALAAGAGIQPAALRYVTIDGRPLRGGRRDRIGWYGDMTFLPHLARLLTVGTVVAEVAWLPPLAIAAGDCRKSLAGRAHAAVAASLGLSAPRTGEIVGPLRGAVAA